MAIDGRSDRYEGNRMDWLNYHHALLNRSPQLGILKQGASGALRRKRDDHFVELQLIRERLQWPYVAIPRRRQHCLWPFFADLQPLVPMPTQLLGQELPALGCLSL